MSNDYIYEVLPNSVPFLLLLVLLLKNGRHLYCTYLLHNILLAFPCLSQGERFVAIMRAYVSHQAEPVNIPTQGVSC